MLSDLVGNIRGTVNRRCSRIVRVNLWWKWSLFYLLWEEVSDLYTCQQKCRQSGERKWSFVLSSMDGQSGDLYTSVAGIHLPVCTRQQQAAASGSNICCKICFISTVYFICRLATNSLF